jgi:hypothetical protein
MVGFSYTFQKRGRPTMQSFAAEILAYYSDAKMAEMASESLTQLPFLKTPPEVEY